MMFILGVISLITATITSSFLFLILPVYASIDNNINNNKPTSAVSSVSKLNSSSIETSINPANVDTEKIRVGDIDVAYKIFGKGDPLLFIPGFSMTMDMWEPMLDGLPENHTIILFDNRGIGQTTAGNETSKATTFTIDQFTNDTAALIDADKTAS